MNFDLKKKFDLFLLLIVYSAIALIGYIYGSGEGRRSVGNQCVFAQEFVVGGRLFRCEEVHPPSEQKGRKL
jgi:hypothetical protein